MAHRIMRIPNIKFVNEHKIDVNEVKKYSAR